MAEAPRAGTISSLNILFLDLAKSLNGDDVELMKNLLRGEQVSKEDMDKLRSAFDVFHHLKDRGHIDCNNLDLLVQLFEKMGKEPLKDMVCKFQSEYSTTTDPLDNTSTSISSRGKDSNKTSSEDYHKKGRQSSKQRRLKDRRKEQRDEESRPMKIRKAESCPIKPDKTKEHSTVFGRRKVKKSLAAVRGISLKKRKSKLPELTGVKSPKETRLNESSRYPSKQYIQPKKDKIPRITGKVSVVIDEIERQSRQLNLEERRMTLKERKVNLKLRKRLLKFVEKVLNSVPEKDIAKNQECKEVLREFRAILNETKSGSLVFILSFLTEEDIDYFWQKYKDGMVEKALSRILIPPSIADKALKAGITIRIKLEIDEKEYEEVKDKLHEMVAVSSACRATSSRVSECGKWEVFVMDQVQDKQQARNLLEQSKFDPVVDALRQEEFFYPGLVSFWFENSYTLPTTVTKATEYAVMHHAEMYCKENNVEIENLREILKARFNDIGKCLYDHITAENVGKLYPTWIDKSISNLESQFFGLLTKSDDYYTCQSKYVYSYIIATYLSNIVALTPNNIPMFLREEKTKILQANMSNCFPYVTGILGEKASHFLKEFVKFSEIQTPVDINNLELLGNCLSESERPYVFARDISEVIGQNSLLDLSTCTAISNKTIHALSVILQCTSLIKDIKLYSKNDEAFLSSEFKECLLNSIGDPLAVDRCTVRINNSHDFSVTAKLLRVLPLLCIHAASRSGSDTTLQPAVTSLTISSYVNILEEIEHCTIEMFTKALSFMPHLEKLSLTGFGNKLCEQVLLCLSEETVILNINTLCLAENELSWKHCRLLLEALNVLPFVTVLDLSKNNIGSLGCTALLPIRDKIDVRVGDNNIAHGLLEILPLCTSTAELPNIGAVTLKSLDDVASLIRNLEHVRHIDCTKLINSQLSKLCQNISLLSNIGSIDLSSILLDEQTVLLLKQRMEYLKELNKVNLSHCIVSRADMKILLQHLSQEVTDLDLSATNMSGLLLDNLKHFKNLKHLNLSNNNLISSDLIFWYIPKTVTHLNLSHNKLHDESFTKLKSLSKLEELDVSYNKLTAADIQSILETVSTSLTALNVSHNNLEEMKEPLENLTQLKQLDLSNNGLHTCLNLFLPSSLRKLDLSHNQITDIGQNFKYLSQLTHLDLSHNKVKLSLHDILTNIPTNVRYLDFSSNSIDNVANVGNIMSSFNDLKFIDLGSNKFSDIGINNLLNDVKNKDMPKINISHNFTLLPHIIDQMPNVSINLEQNNLRLSDVKNSSVFDNLVQVTEVSVSGLSEEKCSGICMSLIMLTNLTKLVMTECYMTNVLNLTTSLKHLNALTELDLSNNKLDSETVCHIVKVLPCNLISVNLSHNMAEGDISLKHLTKLQRLDLSHNNLKLPMNSLLINVSETLKYLDISFNKIQNVNQVGKLLSDFSELCSINMNSNQIGAVGVQTLLSEIQNYDINCDIDVGHNLSGLQKMIPYIANQLPTSAILPDFERENLTLKDEHLQVFFKTISKITTVEIPKNVEWSETDYKSVLNDLSVFSNVECLTFASLNPAVFPFLAESLKNFTYLRHFDISGSRINNYGVKMVGNALLSLKRLEYINFSNTNIGMPDIKFLLDIHLQHTSKPFINVASNVHFVQAISPSIKDQLGGSSIKGIKFDSDELHVISFTGIVQMTQLTNVSAKWKHWTDKDFEDFIQWLKNLNPELLNLSHNNIGDSGAKSLSEGMRSMHGLTHLDLSHNNIEDSGAMRLSEGMMSMRVLTHLDLSHNNIGDHGADSLSEGMMRSMHGLTHLDLSHNNIGYRGADSLSKGMMRSMRVLTHLDLSHNNIGDHGAESLSKGMMRSMRVLTHLDLSHNNIGDSGAMSLSEVIRSMDGLTHLDLSHNNIGDSGAMILSEGMRSMDRLTRLDLSHNNIGDSGAKSLSEMMRSMRGLTHLDLSHNNIGDSGAHRLSERVLSKPRLAHLDLSHNNTQYSGIKSYGEGISSVTSFEKSQAASEKEKATYKSANSSMSYSQGGQHSKEMSYHRAQHKEQTLLPSFPQPSTSGYVPPTEKDPTKS